MAWVAPLFQAGEGEGESIMGRNIYISIYKPHTAKGYDDRDLKKFLRQVKRIFQKFGIEDELTARYPGHSQTVWEELRETGGVQVNHGGCDHGTAIDIEFDRVIYFEQW